MKRNVKRLVSVLLAVVLSFSCVIYSSAATKYVPSSELIDKFGVTAVENYLAGITIQIADSYYYGVSDEDLLYEALCSTIEKGSFDFDTAIEYMMEILDDGYSEFYSPDRYQSVYTSITGSFYGIGVQIMLSGDHVVVSSVFPDSPAEKSGIKSYDTIVSIDGKDISGMSLSDVANMIKREKGASVEVGVIRNGEKLTIDCFCDEVDQNPLSYEIIEDGKIGYIYLSTFSLTMDEYLMPILKEFDEKGIKNVILDIRNNGGGELNAAISLAEKFIPEGVVTKLEYKNPDYDSDVTIETDIKENPYNLVLLVNGNSASASELFAAAVKDRDAGVVIGTKTYGKGSMQTVQRLWTGAGIKYTVAEFHSPDGNRIHEVGVTPDYVVENSSTPVVEAEFKPINFKKCNDTTDGEHILAIEERLYALGALSSEPDMVFDENTKEALMRFQLAKNLDITGRNDVYTVVALNDVIYDFSIENDDQLAAAIQYFNTGNIDEFVKVEEVDE